MPPRKRKTKGKKRRTMKKRLSSAARGARRRASAAARYAYKNPGRIAGAGAGAAGLGLASYEGYLAAKRGLDPYSGLEGTGPYASPTAAAFRRVKKYPFRQRAEEFYASAKEVPGKVKNYPYKDIPSNVYNYNYKAAGSGLLDRMFPGRVTKRKKRKVDEQIRAYNAASGTMPGDNIGSPYGYGKRRRRRRRKKRSFGKKAKKPSASLKRLCKKHKVRLTLKRGKKRVYKSEAMLKKQCKKAMKRKKKKSKK